MVWQKGRSGNPKGRQPDPLRDHVRDYARGFTCEAIDGLVRIVRMTKQVELIDPRAMPAVVKAAEVILNRGWGIPSTEVDLAKRAIEAAASLPDDVLREKARVILMREVVAKRGEAKKQFNAQREAQDVAAGSE